MPVSSLQDLSGVGVVVHAPFAQVGSLHSSPLHVWHVAPPVPHAWVRS